MYRIKKRVIEGLDVADTSVRDLDQSRLGPILTGDREALKDGPPVTAMLIQNTNPAMVCPELELVHKGFAREDLFTCVHEQFLTETAAFADLVCRLLLEKKKAESAACLPLDLSHLIS